jgi:integrase
VKQPQSLTSSQGYADVIQSVPRKSLEHGDLSQLAEVSHTAGTPTIGLHRGTTSHEPTAEGKLARKKVEKRSRGQIISRGKNKWLVRTFIGVTTDTTGKKKRNYSSQMIHGTYKQAEQALTSDLRDQDTEQFVPPAKQTLSEFMADWFENTAKMRVSETTLLSYKSSTKRGIAAIGHLKLDKLTPQIMQKVYADLAAQGISPRTIEMGHTVMKMALEQAVVWRLLLRNPTKGAERPKKIRHEAEAFTSEQADLFLEAAKSHPLYAMWLFFYSTGLRPQEMFPLKWTDLEERLVRVQRDGEFITVPSTVVVVQRAMKHVGKGQYVVREIMKTRKSRRVISLPQSLVDALSAHKRQQAQAMLASGESFERNGYVFPNTVGRPLDVSNVLDMFKALCKTAKVPVLTTYALRHTHATELLRAGVPLKVVSERLGHTTIVMTGDIYSHVMPEVEHETALTVESMLRRSRKVS